MLSVNTVMLCSGFEQAVIASTAERKRPVPPKFSFPHCDPQLPPSLTPPVVLSLFRKELVSLYTDSCNAEPALSCTQRAQIPGDHLLLSLQRAEVEPEIK